MRDLEDHLKTADTNDVPPIPQPDHGLDDSPPRWNEVSKTMRNLELKKQLQLKNKMEFHRGCIQMLQISWDSTWNKWRWHDRQTIQKLWQRAGGWGLGGLINRWGRGCLKYQPILAIQSLDWHILLWTALDFFHVSMTNTDLARNYFQGLQVWLTTKEYTTGWQYLEVGIMAGCIISTLDFTQMGCRRGIIEV